MGLFGSIFGKRNAIHCARCNNTVKENDIKGHDGKVYCSSCYNRILEEEKRRTKTRTGAGTSTGTKSIHIDTTHDYTKCPDPIQEIRDTFTKADIKYRVNHFGDQWEVVAPIGGKENNYEIKFICKEPISAVALRVFSLAHFEKDKHEKLYPLLNQLQEKYRFLRFTLDADNDIKLEYDIPLLTTGIGAVSLELLLRTMQIVDDVYPDLMKCSWA